MAKKKATYSWSFDPSSTKKSNKPSDLLKRQVEEAMKPVLEEANAKLAPLKEPQEFNQGVYFYGKWFRNFYYIYEKMKCPPGAIKEEFDYGIARLKYVGDNQFDMAYFRHTEKWEELFTHSNMSLDECIKAVKEDPWFLSNIL